MRDQRGLSTVEYVVMLVLVVAVGVAAWNSFGANLSGKLGDAAGTFDSVVRAGALSSSDGDLGGITVVGGVTVRDAGHKSPASDRDKKADAEHAGDAPRASDFGLPVAE